MSSTAVEVSWSPPANHRDLITGYRVYYHISSPHGTDLTHTRWDVKDVEGRRGVAKLTQLEPDAQYTVRVRARGADGRLGNFSEAVVVENTGRYATGLLYCRCYRFSSFIFSRPY